MKPWTTLFLLRVEFFLKQISINWTSHQSISKDLWTHHPHLAFLFWGGWKYMKKKNFFLDNLAVFPIYPYICQRACFDIKGPAVSLEGVYGDGRWLWIEWLPRPDQRLTLTFGDSLAHFWLSKVYKGHAIGLLESRGCFETAKTMILFSERKKSTFNKSHIFGSLCNYSSICFICIVVKKKNWKKKKIKTPSNSLRCILTELVLSWLE